MNDNVTGISGVEQTLRQLKFIQMFLITTTAEIPGKAVFAITILADVSFSILLNKYFEL